MVMARWPWPSRAPAAAAPAAIAAATRRLVEAGAGADLAGRGEIDHQHAHRPVGLRLQDEAALELERRAQQHPEHDRLAQKLGDRRRIAVAAEDLVDGGAEPHQPSAQVEGLDLERQHRVVGGCRGRRPFGNGDIGHCEVQVRSVRAVAQAPPAARRSGFHFSGSRAGAVTYSREDTRPGCPFGRAGGSRPRRTPPTADRRSPRR